MLAQPPEIPTRMTISWTLRSCSGVLAEYFNCLVDNSELYKQIRPRFRQTPQPVAAHNKHLSKTTQPFEGNSDITMQPDVVIQWTTRPKLIRSPSATSPYLPSVTIINTFSSLPCFDHQQVLLGRFGPPHFPPKIPKVSGTSLASCKSSSASAILKMVFTNMLVVAGS